MHFIGSEACRRANGVIIGVFDVGKVCIPVILVFVADHGEHLRHVVVYAFNATVPARVAGACRELVCVQTFVDGCPKLCAELESVV